MGKHTGLKDWFDALGSTEVAAKEKSQFFLVEGSAIFGEKACKDVLYAVCAAATTEREKKRT